MNKKILILGKGFIGSRLQQEWGCRMSENKIASFYDAEKELDRYKPKIIINAIGSIGRNVDDCELDKDKSLMSNTFVPIMLAEACLRRKIKFVHISSGCIFHYDYAREKPIDEKKQPDFYELFYSRTKIYAEAVLKSLAAKYPVLIVRLRVPLDDRPSPKNLLDKLISYQRVIDLPNSVTYIPDFIKALKHLIRIDALGIYNIANKGGLRYPDLLDAYRSYVSDFHYEVIDFRKLGLVRTNLVLSTRKLQQSGFKVRNIKDVLDECVRNYISHKKT